MLAIVVFTAYYYVERVYKNIPYYSQLKTQEYPRWIKTVTLVTESVQKRINKIVSDTQSCSGLETLKQEVDQKIKTLKDYFYQLNCGTSPNLLSISVYYGKQQILLTQHLKALFLDFYKRARQAVKLCKAQETNKSNENK